MDITRQEIGNLNEIIKIKVVPDDYTKQYDSEVKKYQKSVNLPGFRPGNVPAGLIKKKFGRSILVEELNKIVSGSLQNYIDEQKLNILGSPIALPNGSDQNNWDQPDHFEFTFEIGLAPEFELELPPKKSFEYLEIEVDEDRINTYVEDIQRKFGDFSNPEESEPTSILYGDFSELDEHGGIKEGGIVSKSTLSVELVSDKAAADKLVGLKKGEKVTINLASAFNKNPEEIAQMLNIPKEQVPEIKSDFVFLVDSINKIVKAEIGQDLFDKVYGKDEVKSEEEMRNRVKGDIQVMFNRESDFKLKHDLEDFLLSELKLSLPDDFLKKWLQTSVEKPLSEEQVEKEYSQYSRGMKLRLVENRIFRDQDLKITEEEIREKARQYIMAQFQGYGSALTDDIMDNLIGKYLEKRESVDRIIETLSEEKVFNYLKSVIKTKNKQVSYDKFIKIVKDHHHEHHH